MNIRELKITAKRIRYDSIVMAPEGGRIHWGGCLSQVDILTVLYFNFLKIDPQNPNWPERDRFILSKGHGSWSLYATMANRGYFCRERLRELDEDGGDFPKHADRLRLPGIEVSCGALGQGLSVGLGMALAAKLDNANWRVYVLLGDGECMEGQIYEAMLSGAKHWPAPTWMKNQIDAKKFRLDNLTVIVDNNRMTLDERIEEVMDSLNLVNLWQAAGWKVFECDGHNMKDLVRTLKAALKVKNQPQVIIANTTKGKGVSFMEDRHGWHIGTLSEEEADQAVAELRVW